MEENEINLSIYEVTAANVSPTKSTSQIMLQDGGIQIVKLKPGQGKENKSKYYYNTRRIKIVM